MFDYSIGHYQKRPPNRRLFISWIASCLAHACAVLILIEYPQLLEGGKNLWFRQPAYGPSLTQSKQWRSVAFVGSTMELPPPEVLKKFVYDWNRKPAKAEETPSIRVNIPVSPKEIPGAPATLSSSPAPVSVAPTSPTLPAVSPGDAARVQLPGEAKKPTTTSPPASTQNVAPKEIPKGVAEIPPAASGSTLPGSGSTSQARSQNKGGQEQQSGVQVQGGVTFDAKGFPLDEYISVIKERVKENWFIASNLRDSQGSVTVFFYIYRDGHYDNLHKEVSSGNGSLDNSALLAVITASPFPPLPKGFPTDRVGARFVFAYNERK
jgi:TonB family protein